MRREKAEIPFGKFNLEGERVRKDLWRGIWDDALGVYRLLSSLRPGAGTCCTLQSRATESWFRVTRKDDSVPRWGMRCGNKKARWIEGQSTLCVVSDPEAWWVTAGTDNVEERTSSDNIRFYGWRESVIWCSGTGRTSCLQKSYTGILMSSCSLKTGLEHQRTEISKNQSLNSARHSVMWASSQPLSHSQRQSPGLSRRWVCPASLGCPLENTQQPFLFIIAFPSIFTNWNI